jgi:hypothetical protein
MRLVPRKGHKTYCNLLIQRAPIIDPWKLVGGCAEIAVAHSVISVALHNGTRSPTDPGTLAGNPSFVEIERRK